MLPDTVAHLLNNSATDLDRRRESRKYQDDRKHVVLYLGRGYLALPAPAIISPIADPPQKRTSYHQC
jgi:hypothetical protein